MTVLCVILATWTALATYGWFYNRKSAIEWRVQYMIAIGCDTLETRKWTSPTK